MLYRVGFVFLGLLAFCGTSAADTWNKKTILTVYESILVPGKTLEPGKYVMKLVDSQADRHIVQILNEREDFVYTTILAIPNYRLKPTGDTQFAWWETPSGNPMALRAWFYPGDNFGQEFAYPKGLSARIAREAKALVPTTQAQTPEELLTAPVTTVDQVGVETLIPQEPVQITQVLPVPEPAPLPVPPAAAVEPAPVPAQLPETGSPIYAIGFAGLSALATGLALRFSVKR